MRSAAKKAAVLACASFLIGCVTTDAGPPSVDKASQVQLSEADLPKIVVQPFEGTFRIFDTAGQLVRHQDTVRLEFARTGKSAQFFSESRSWATTVAIRDGALHLDFGYATRPFTLHESDSGKLELRARYQSVSQQGPFIGEAILLQQ